jgi:hypothetical protein
MASLNADYRIEQGSTFVLEFQVFDDDLLPVDMLSYDGTTYSLGDYRLRMKIKRTKYRDSLVYSCGITQNFVIQPSETHQFTTDGFYFLGGSTGMVRFVITADTTIGFKAANHLYDVELVKDMGNGTITSKLMMGKIDLDAESTR